MAPGSGAARVRELVGFYRAAVYFFETGEPHPAFFDHPLGGQIPGMCPGGDERKLVPRKTILQAGEGSFSGITLAPTTAYEAIAEVGFISFGPVF